MQEWTRDRLKAGGWMLLVAALTVLVQWPLVSNPGYFSHDELQWAAAANVAPSATLPWVDWFDLVLFQYRPLTFNLWLWLSHHLFDQPQAFHAVVVATGALNAALLAGLLGRLEVSPRRAALAALMFALGPYAMYVHGWVGTIGDLLWVGCGLLVAWVATSRWPGWRIAIAAAGLTAVALLAKEAALSIPALLAVAWWLDRTRGSWRWAFAGSVVPALAYLLLRLSVLAGVDGPDAAYAWSLANIPQRWLEYYAFLPQISVFEAHATLARGFGDTRFIVSCVLMLALLAALWRVGWRWAVALLAGGAAALGPVLVLAGASNQYGYGFAAFAAGLVACAWPRLARWGRVLVVVLAVLSLWHGINVMRQVRQVGEVQAVFSPALAELLRHDDAAVVRLRVAEDVPPWIFQRLTHDIPSYDGVPIRSRVQLVPSGDADQVIQADGRLTPAP
ncbi:hypothetical protein [Lysobacter sp. A289]